MQHDDQIKKFMRIADLIIGNPPTSCEQIKDVVGPLYAEIPLLRMALAPDKISTAEMTLVADKMCKLRDCLFMTMCDNYAELSNRETLAMKHPGSAASVVFLYCAALTVISQDNLQKMSADRYSFLRNLGLCIYKTQDDPGTDPREYSAQTILDLVWLLSIRWPLLRLTDKESVSAIQSHLLYLSHRALFIVGTPHGRDVLDCKLDKYCVKVENHDFYKATPDLVRRFLDPLCRMMAHVRFFLLTQIDTSASLSAPFDQRAMRAEVRRTIETSVATMQKMPSLRQEIRMMYDRLCIRHVDFALFVERCNSEPYEPSTMMMMTKTPEFQTASIRFCNCIDLGMLVSMVNEEDRDYAAKIDIATHLHAQNMKLHAIESQLRQAGIRLRADYVTSEADLLVNFRSLHSEASPSFVSFMGMYHVYFNNTIYLCPGGIEQAFCKWASIVHTNLGGVIDGNNVNEAFSRIFGINRFAAQTTNVQIAWGTGDII